MSHSNEDDMVEGITDVLPSPGQEAAITVLKRLDKDQVMPWLKTFRLTKPVFHPRFGPGALSKEEFDALRTITVGKNENILTWLRHGCLVGLYHEAGSALSRPAYLTQSADKANQQRPNHKSSSDTPLSDNSSYTTSRGTTSETSISDLDANLASADAALLLPWEPKPEKLLSLSRRQTIVSSLRNNGPGLFPEHKRSPNDDIREESFSDWNDDSSSADRGILDEIQNRDSPSPQVGELDSKTQPESPMKERMGPLKHRMMGHKFQGAMKKGKPNT